MASLDDFFAKKDKRKKGKTKNFVTSELLVKTIEEQSAAPQPPPEQENKAKIDFPAVPTQEDEWKEEEELVKDFEGLRVQKLDKENEGKEPQKVPVTAENEENGTEEETRLRELSSSSSPWQTVTTSQADTSSQEDSTDPEHEIMPEKLPNVQGDVYVPPASRGGGGGGGAYVPPAAREGGAYVPPHAKRGGSGAYVPPSMRRGGMGRGRGNRLPPDLKSAVAFPSLHDVAKKGEGSSSEKGSEFKEAQGPKTSRPSDGSYRVPGLELTNKFSGLENN